MNNLNFFWEHEINVDINRVTFDKTWTIYIESLRIHKQSPVLINSQFFCSNILNQVNTNYHLLHFYNTRPELCDIVIIGSKWITTWKDVIIEHIDLKSFR